MRSIRAILATGALLSAACTGVGPLSPTVGDLGVRADNPILTAIGSQTRLHLEFPDGSTSDFSDVVWTSGAPGVASVDPSGTVTALGHGTATITAAAAGLTASTTITVDVEIRTTVRVRSSGLDGVAGNDAATVTLTVRAN